MFATNGECVALELIRLWIITEPDIRQHTAASFELAIDFGNHLLIGHVVVIQLDGAGLRQRAIFEGRGDLEILLRFEVKQLLITEFAVNHIGQFFGNLFTIQHQIIIAVFQTSQMIQTNTHRFA